MRARPRGVARLMRIEDGVRIPRDNLIERVKNALFNIRRRQKRVLHDDINKALGNSRLAVSSAKMHAAKRHTRAGLTWLLRPFVK